MPGTVNPIVPLSLLEAVRTVDIPEGDDVEVEYVQEHRNKRLGLSETVIAQIRRYKEALKRNQQIAIRHSRVSRIVELHVALADLAVADAWLKGSGSPQEITQTELSQYNNLCRALFFHFEDSFYQREEGLLNDDAFETVVAGARLSARSPGFRAAWRIARPNFGGRFLEFMNGVVAGSAAEPPVDLSLEAWKVAFASEVSGTS